MPPDSTPVPASSPGLKEEEAVGQEAASASDGAESRPITELRVVLAGPMPSGRNVDEVTAAVQAVGGTVVARVSGAITALVVADAEVAEGEGEELALARVCLVPVVSLPFLDACVAAGRLLPLQPFLLVDNIRDRGTRDASSVSAGSKSRGLVAGVVQRGKSGGGRRQRVLVKGRAAVEADSGLEEEGFVLDEGGSVYSCTLVLTNVDTGLNTCYKIQVHPQFVCAACFCRCQHCPTCYLHRTNGTNRTVINVCITPHVCPSALPAPLFGSGDWCGG